MHEPFCSFRRSDSDTILGDLLSLAAHLSESLVENTLTSALAAASFRPGPDGISDLYGPPTDPEGIARVIEDYVNSVHLPADAGHQMLALQFGIFATDEDLDRWTRADEYSWPRGTRQEWLRRFHRALFPNVAIPTEPPSIALLPAGNTR
ncbi:MAG: hypothetical protein IPG45_04500 [Deltaproteobacteria bacterium]|nr:hypothetical protein [Deltaproteobacteria bacterium]